MNDSTAAKVAAWISSCTGKTAPWQLDLGNCAIKDEGFNAIMNAINDHASLPTKDKDGKAAPIFLRIARNHVSEATIKEWTENRPRLEPSVVPSD